MITTRTMSSMGRYCRSGIAISALMLSSLAAPVAAAPAEGEIVIVSPAEPPDLDPGNHDYSFTGRVIRQNVIETLNTLDLSDSSLKPRLATAWEQTGDQTWRYTLREGVKFHDGADFNADAVVYSMKRLFNPDIPQIVRAKYLDFLTIETTKIDDYTVEFTSDVPAPLFFTRLSTAPIVSPNTPMNELTRSPIGTGPYKVANWQAGVEIVLERFDGYWGEQPEVEKATFTWRGEGSVRANMVEVGEADFTSNIPSQLATTDMDVPYFDFETLYFIIGAWEAPLDDVRVRKALQYAVDREAMLGSVIPDSNLLATALFKPGISGSNPDLKPYPYDKEKVTALLDEARADGVDVDAEITVIGIAGKFPGSDEILEVVTFMLNDAGFNAKMKLVETGVYRQYRDKPRTDGGPVLLMSQHDNDKGDAGFSLTRHLCSSNRNPICDEELDAKIDAALVASGDERRALWQEVVRYMHEDVVVDLLLVHQTAIARVGPRINYDVADKNAGNFLIENVTFK